MPLPSVFSPNKNLEEMATGDFVDTWGARLNANVIALIDQILGTAITIPVTNVDVTISTAQTQNLTFLVTGVLTGNVALVLPAVAGGFYFIKNGTTGAFTLSIKTATLANTIVLPQGTSNWIVSDGNLVYIANDRSEAFQSVASAATTDLSLSATRNVQVTGSATITSFGTAFSSDYPLYCVIFSGAAVITNNASIACPGAANITTQAGSMAWIQALTPTTVRVLTYSPADGSSFNPATTTVPGIMSAADKTKLGIGPAPDLWIRYEVPSGTAGGTYTAGADATCPLNTVKRNAITGASLAANQVTLPAGTYYSKWRTWAGLEGLCQSLLFNVTDAVTIERGDTGAFGPGLAIASLIAGAAFFTIASPKVIEVRFRGTNTRATDGLGQPASFGTEVYRDLEIWKIS